jgi:uncharacterized protein (TIGR02466 family)|tara:strand:- start:170 stop:796 length:627 start_codon:yes stop_codon:yes gene_type:complete
MDNQTTGQVMPLFPTPIYTYKLEDSLYTDVQNELRIAVNDLYSNDKWGQPPDWSSTSQFLSNKGNFFESVLNDKNMETVSSVIMHHCLEFMKIQQVKSNYKPGFESSWLTLTKPGLSSHIHDHGCSHISGVYWFKTNGEDGDLVLRNSFKALVCNPLGADNAEAHFSPEQGRIVFWPGYLDHGVNENKTSEDRISLSFNIILETGQVV